MITHRDKLECAVRELDLRRRVYPRFIEKGRMSQRKADREIELMEAIVFDYYAKCQQEERIAEGIDQLSLGV